MHIPTRQTPKNLRFLPYVPSHISGGILFASSDARAIILHNGLCNDTYSVTRVARRAGALNGEDPI